MISLIASLSFTHFAFDMFLWSKRHNPDWMKALEPSLKTEEKTENVTSIAA
jgi:hypothetical protein